MLTLAEVYFCNSSGLLVFPHASTPFPNCIALLLFKGGRKKKCSFRLVQIENESHSHQPAPQRKTDVQMPSTSGRTFCWRSGNVGSRPCFTTEILNGVQGSCYDLPCPPSHLIYLDVKERKQHFYLLEIETIDLACATFISPLGNLGADLIEFHSERSCFEFKAEEKAKKTFCNDTLPVRAHRGLWSCRRCFVAC